MSSSPSLRPAEASADLLEALHATRFSCRAFRPEPVPRSTIRRILEIAQRTATWCNTQPWKVIVTEGAGTERFRQGLYDYALSATTHSPDFPWPREYRGAYLQRRRETGKGLYEALGITREDQAGRLRQLHNNYLFFGAPHVALITTDEPLGTYGALDCGGYVANFLLAARSLGVDTCAQAALAHHGAYVRKHFSIPDDRLFVCGISFGYADPGHPANKFRVGRAPIDEEVEWIAG